MDELKESYLDEYGYAYFWHPMYGRIYKDFDDDQYPIQEGLARPNEKPSNSHSPKPSVCNDQLPPMLSGSGSIDKASSSFCHKPFRNYEAGAVT